jgi:membrane protease YdiL (CAAX protease family)
MAWAAAAGFGALLATGAVMTAVALRLVAIARSRTRRFAALAGQIVMLIISAATEELLFRVLLLGAIARVAPDPIAVVVSAVVFGIPHVIRGNGNEEQRANAVTSAAFGIVVGSMWVAHHDFAAIAAFHAAFNIVAGLVLGGGAVDPLSDRLPKVTWPLALREVRQYTGASLFSRTVVAELLPLAVIAVLLRATNLL